MSGLSFKLVPSENEISSRLSPDEKLSGAPYAVSDSLTGNVGTPNNPIVSRLANATTVFALPIAVEAILGNSIGLTTRHLWGGASNAMGTAGHLLRVVRELYNGEKNEAMFHAAQASSHAYNAMLNSLAIGGIYLLPELWVIESVASVAAPSLSRELFGRLSDAPNGFLANRFGIEKPYLLRVKNEDGSSQAFPITAQEKEKIESGELKQYSLVPNRANNGYDIKFSGDAAPRARAPRARASASRSPSRRIPAKKASPLSGSGVTKRTTRKK